LGWDIERRATRALRAYEACIAQLRHLHAAATLNQITVGDIAEFGEEYLEESAVEITRQIETTVIDIEALVTSLRRLANAAADAGDGND
jgi:hypothetical protein